MRENCLNCDSSDSKDSFDFVQFSGIIHQRESVNPTNHTALAFQFKMFKADPTRSYPTQTESRTIIRFQDCDPLQHLNNAKYFDYYFNAREDQVAKLYDFSPGQLFRELKTSWVVYQHQIAYVRPAQVSEWVRITSRLIYYSDDTTVTEYFMTDDGKTHLKNVLWVTSKYISVATGKRIQHDEVVTGYLQTTIVPNIDFASLNFNDRIRDIKQQIIAPFGG